MALLATRSGPDQEWHCDNPQAQMEMNACAPAIDFERADASWRTRNIAARSPWARDDDREERVAGDDRPGDEAALRKGATAWVAFRDAHCRLEGDGERGGNSMEPMV